MGDTQVLRDYFALPFAWTEPAAEAQLAAMEAALKMRWPPVLPAVYQQHDGTSGLPGDWEEQWADQLVQDEDCSPDLPRLMPLAEVGEFYRATAEIMNPEVRFFWTDDNSNYVGVYVEGPLTGCVCLLNHGEPNTSPRSRDVPDFLAATLAQPTVDAFDTWEFQTTYPAIAPDPQHAQQDWHMAQALYARIADHDDGTSQALASAMTMTPYEHSGVLVDYLASSDHFVAERAAQILGARRYSAARTAIERLAVSGLGNAKAAATRALGDWDISENRE